MKPIRRMPPVPVKTPIRPGFRPKLRYMKEGKGSLYLFDAIIKPGQVISVYPEDIPEKYKSAFTCLESPELQEWAKKENEETAVKEVLYDVVDNETKGWYDVINVETSKPINEKKLRKADAERLCSSLNL